MQTAARPKGRQTGQSWALLLLGLIAGCTAVSRQDSLSQPSPSSLASPSSKDLASNATPICRASYLQVQAAEREQSQRPGAGPVVQEDELLHAPAAQPQEVDSSAAAAVPLAGKKELAVEELVQAVLERSPTVPQMEAAWQAAKARYPQVTSLDDPFFGTTLAPASLGMNGNGNTSGYRFEVFQRFPFPGKLQLRGEKALAEASAAGREVDNARVQLTESARAAFYDYYLAHRAVEVNQDGLRLLGEIRGDAQARFRNGVTKNDQEILQVEVEIGRQRQRFISLERARQVAVARINALMHLPPTCDLPPPPQELSIPQELPDPQEMLATALSQRLDLLALKDRIAAAEAAVKIACREFYPDFDAMAAYDNFWSQTQLRPQIALRINVPVRRERRSAAVAEAKARLSELRAQYAQQTDVVGYEVQQVYEQLRESYRIVRLFEKEVLAKTRSNVKTSQESYVNGQIPLSTLIEAERSLVGLRDSYYEAVTELFRRRTVLERALSGSPSAAPIPMPARQPGPGQEGYPTTMGAAQGP
jgi:outer membrane protein TolC